jgi:hypothetical protein
MIESINKKIILFSCAEIECKLIRLQIMRNALNTIYYLLLASGDFNLIVFAIWISYINGISVGDYHKADSRMENDEL